MPEQIKLSLIADYASYEEFTQKLTAFHEQSQMRSDYAYALDLALEELITNIIKYGGVGDNVIDVSIEYSPDELAIVIEDSSNEFDPTTSEEPDLSLPLEQRPVGKMGLMMVRNIFSEFTYRRLEGKNIVTLRLRGYG